MAKGVWELGVERLGCWLIIIFVWLALALLITDILPSDDPPQWLFWVVFVSIPLMLLIGPGLASTPWDFIRGLREGLREERRRDDE